MRGNIHKAFDATGLNVYAHITHFGRTKSISFRLFKAALRSIKTITICKDSLGAVRVRKARRKLAHMRRCMQ